MASSSTASKRATAPAGQPAAEAAQAPGSGKKPKLVRDSFTIPKAEYAAIDSLKDRALAAGRSVKKSELLRAGLLLLTRLDNAALAQALAAVPPLKTGRPKQQPEQAPAAAAKAKKPGKATQDGKADKPSKAPKAGAAPAAAPAAPAAPQGSVTAAARKAAGGRKAPAAKPSAPAKPQPTVAAAPAPAGASRKPGTQPA